MRDDLISRKAAINTVFSMCCRWDTDDPNDLKNMLLTAFQDLPSAQQEQRWIPFNEPLKVLESAPTADVVEVVRCKDCKWFDGQECCERLGIFVGLDLSFFCKKGERRNDEDKKD